MFPILGIGYLLTPSVTQHLKGNIEEILTIKKMSPVGDKGNNTNEVILSVSTDAINASSIVNSRETKCLSEIHSINLDWISVII